MRGNASRLFGLLLVAYRVCLRLSPRQSRARFGAESEAAFESLVEETRTRRGRLAATLTAMAACFDAAIAGLTDRLADLKRRVSAGSRADVRQALRIYWREPTLACTLALTLALVAGPAVALFTVLYQQVLAPLPYPEADRLVVVQHRSEAGAGSYLRADAVSNYRAVESFSAVGGFRRLGMDLIFDGQVNSLLTYETTAGFLTTLGVPFSAGRDLVRGAEEAVITRSFARARFGGEAAAIGRTFQTRGQPVRVITIVGVLAYLPPLPGGPGNDIFIPHRAADAVVPQRGGQNTFVIARLAPAAALAIATEQSRAVAASVSSRFPQSGVYTADLISLDRAVSGSMRAPLLALSAAAAVVFLIAITSLASLVLARAAARSSDVAVRQSIGASRWQLVRSWLIDGAALALPGMLLGIVLGTLLLRYGRANLPSGVVPIAEEFALGPMVVAATLLAASTAVLFAIAPAASGLLRAHSLIHRQHAGHVTGLRRLRLQSVLIVGQVALSVGLVTTTAWLSVSLWRTLTRPLGFDASGLIVVSTRSLLTREAELAAAVTIAERLDQMEPGQVAASSALPGAYANVFVPLRIRASQPILPELERPDIAASSVSSGYFEVLGIPLIQGRTFTPEDERTPNTAIIVSRSFAAKWFPEGALGEVVTLSRLDQRTIVGIAEDAHVGSLITDTQQPQAYFPLTSGSPGGMPSTFIIRTPKSPESVRASITALITQIDPTATVTVMTSGEAMSLPLRLRSTSNRLTAGLAAVALLIAVVNVYGLSALVVVQRTREIGIRLALGARATEAMGVIMRRGLTWVATGLMLGISATLLFVAPLVRSQMRDADTSDPRLWLSALFTVAIAAALASWLPARRASRIDPAITLRTE